MQEFWGLFEIIALVILFCLQIYFLILAIVKMRLMSRFFPDVSSIGIKRIPLDENGNEIIEKKSNVTSDDADGSETPVVRPASKQETDMTSVPSIERMRTMKPEELSTYVKNFGKAFMTVSMTTCYLRPMDIVLPKDSIVSLKPSSGRVSLFAPPRIYSVEGFKSMMKNAENADKLYEVVESDSPSGRIKILSKGECEDIGSFWKVVKKCKISI